MKKSTLFTFIFLLLMSCNYIKYKDYKTQILGEWTYIGEEELYEFKSAEEMLNAGFGSHNKNGYIFNQNDSCESKKGYFTTIKQSKDDEDILIYLGTKTSYKIDKDSLRILNLENQKWDAEKIYSITNDTLKFQIDKRRLAIYAKVKPVNHDDKLFDICIVSSSGCYGSCPISDVMIKSTGDVFYFGSEYNLKNGYFKSKLSEVEFHKIEESFKKANILELKEKYEAEHTDDERITMTFIKAGKIIKSISDYGRESPIALQNAYTPLRFISQTIKMDTVSNIPKYMECNYIWLQNADSICDISKAESFYLRSLLIESPKVTLKPNPKYKIKSCNNVDAISDGKLFQFTNAKKEKMTLDLGFYFLTHNNLMHKFRLKHGYEH